MDLEKEVEYRLARWVFANIYHEGKIDKRTYHRVCVNKFSVKTFSSNSYSPIRYVHSSFG